LIYFNNESTGENTVLFVTGGFSYQNVYANTALEAYRESGMSTNYVYGDCDFTNMKFYGSEWGQEIGVNWTKYVDPFDEQYIDGLNVIIYGSSHTRLETGRDG
jgi:hypothetical protein